MISQSENAQPTALKQPDVATLTDCVDEPITAPGSIQPHGALLALQVSDFKVIAASENIAAFLGVSVEQLLGQPLDLPFLAQAMSKARGKLESGDKRVVFEVATGSESQSLIDCTAVLQADGLNMLVEFDNLRDPQIVVDFEHLSLPRIQQLILNIGQPDSLNGLCETIVREIRNLAGFDRVMVYRFHADLHGEVVAESAVSGEMRYLGLHFPESDIPAQARVLYSTNLIRCITNSTYTPTPILTLEGLCPGSTLDLSESKLRSVSPIHLEYLQNMKVGSSMSLSLMDGDKLWGLVACHHDSPHFVDSQTRIVCELLSTTFSLMLLQIESQELDREALRLQGIERQLISQMANSTPFVEGAFKHLPNLSNLADANGSASISGDSVKTIGDTPTDQEIIALATWLADNCEESVFACESLMDVYPPALKWEHGVCGVLAIEIARSRRQYLLSFRNELTQSVLWAGDPNKAVGGASGVSNLSPRTSFESWTQIIRGHCKPWSQVAIDGAATLRRATLYLIVDWSEQVAELNQKLAQSNDDLQTFAEFAAHDLKEPLRGIHNAVAFLRQDHGSVLNEDIEKRLQKITMLADRGHALTGALLQFSEIGTQKLAVESVDLNLVCAETLSIYQEDLDSRGIDVQIPELMPSVFCDPVLIGQVLQNLVSNAIKYAAEESPHIIISWSDHVPVLTDWDITGKPDTRQVVISVADNGIGIDASNQEVIFKLFRRLHPRHLYGGGHGIGLAIANRIIGMHSGKLWVESVKGEGSIFSFTVGDPSV